MAAPTPPADLAAFVRRHGRLPRLGDSPPPWQYCGWLLPYVIELHRLVPAVADRWAYHLRTLEAGALLNEPIPQISFGPPDARVVSLLHAWPGLIDGGCGGWGAFHALLDWLCWGLALGAQEPRVDNDANERLYRGVNLGPLLERPHDYLIDPQGASFLDDESDVMGQMLNRAVDHLVHGPTAAIAYDSRPLPRFRW